MIRWIKIRLTIRPAPEETLRWQHRREAIGPVLSHGLESRLSPGDPHRGDRSADQSVSSRAMNWSFPLMILALAGAAAADAALRPSEDVTQGDTALRDDAGLQGVTERHDDGEQEKNKQQQNDKQQQGDKEQQFYISQIFNKYGDGGVITFEGLEHLMESLGIGKIKFDKSHNISLHKTEDGGFKDIHDTTHLHTHEHNSTNSTELTRNKRAVDANELHSNSCLRPTDLLKLYGLETDHQVEIVPERFLQICPAIISQLDSRVCAVPVHNHGEHGSALPVTMVSRPLLWAYGIGSIIIVSLCGIIGFAFFPLLGKSKCQSLCSLLSSLSIGTLAGDALLHLIPHALHNKEDETDGLLKLSFIFLVLMALFIYESFIHLRETVRLARQGKSDLNGTELSPVQDTKVHPSEEGGHGHSHHGGSIVQMVLGGDFLHNLTDGLAIGAAYGQHPITGFATTIAVLLHEVPHELGDLAILLDSGVSVKKALIFNILSSFFSLLGAIVGLIVGKEEKYAQWVYAFTAGSFLYIALATLMPDMFKKTKTVGRLLLHTTGIFLGGVIMFFIAMYEHQLHEVIEEFAL
ncbi:hypothetical protein GE061_009603 [Apolygus lucorum]|uniref:Zinc transporter ZIP4/12 EF-hand domain-containing protein n=1 Tax=Apolygus lucorum TaxID=248454 RepID=A0A8S9Y277_APOLU|nr:hypothetical protein GE061_009603 [Apolygus lucorum]